MRHLSLFTLITTLMLGCTSNPGEGAQAGDTTTGERIGQHTPSADTARGGPRDRCDGCADDAISPADDADAHHGHEVSAPPPDIISGDVEGDDAALQDPRGSEVIEGERAHDTFDAETSAPSDADLSDITSAEVSDEALSDSQGQGEAGAEELEEVGPDDDSEIDDGPSQEGCTDPTSWPKRVLFIGNSYTGYNGGLDTALSAFAAGHPCSPGYAMTTKRHAPGGKMLFHHYAQATTEGSALHALLNEPEGWDVIVLQDQSQVPGFPASAAAEKQQNLDVIEDFTLLIEATGAELVFFMTWGRRDGDPNNAWLFPDYTEMQNQLAQGYAEYAALAQGVATQPVTIAPVGDGWRAVHDNSFVLPVSTEVAYARFQSLYAGDGSHPSARGTYLAAAIFFEVLTGAPAQGGTWQHTQVDDADKGWLDEAATLALMPQ